MRSTLSSVGLCLLCYWSFIGNGSVSYVIHVTETDNDGVIKRWEYKREWKGDGAFHSGKSILRRIRSSPVRHPEAKAECLRTWRQMKDRHHGAPANIAKLTGEGRELVLQCDVCGTDSSSLRELYDIQWYKLNYSKSTDLYKITPVELDLHDDEAENRIITDRNVSLIIRRLRMDDTGTYFCNNGKGVSIKSRMTVEDLSRFYQTFRYIYHVDVIPEKDEILRIVSLSEDETPLPNEIIAKENLIMETIWEPWTSCIPKFCGLPGRRKRIGRCVYSKMNPSEPSGTWLMNSIMSSFDGGVPCMSSEFQRHVNIPRRLDELMVESCENQCQGKVTSVDNLENMVKGAKSAKRVNVDGKFGHAIELKCPSAKPWDVVVWLNGSIYISPEIVDNNRTHSRCHVDALNVLHIQNLQSGDGNTFSCIFGEKIQAKIILKVSSRPHINEIIAYLRYVGISYGALFIILMFFLAVKHKHRKTQTVVNIEGKISNDSWIGMSNSDTMSDQQSAETQNSTMTDSDVTDSQDDRHAGKEEDESQSSSGTHSSMSIADDYVDSSLSY